MTRPFLPILFSLLTLLGCHEARSGGTISGRISAAGTSRAVPCIVEINSDSSPFYAPVLLQVESGRRFEWRFTGAPLPDVYVGVVCEGYEGKTLVKRQEGGVTDVDVGEITLRPAADNTDTHEPHGLPNPGGAGEQEDEPDGA